MKTAVSGNKNYVYCEDKNYQRKPEVRSFTSAAQSFSRRLWRLQGEVLLLRQSFKCKQTLIRRFLAFLWGGGTSRFCTTRELAGSRIPNDDVQEGVQRVGCWFVNSLILHDNLPRGVRKVNSTKFTSPWIADGRQCTIKKIEAINCDRQWLTHQTGET